VILAFLYVKAEQKNERIETGVGTFSRACMHAEQASWTFARQVVSRVKNLIL
jgi:hypothetical protein